MRPTILAFTAAAVLLSAPATHANLPHAAPTCRNENLDPAACGAPGAMPAGWTPSARQVMDHQQSPLPSPSPDDVLDLICVIGGLFALIALMPPFDGRNSSDWGEQQSDGEDRD